MIFQQLSHFLRTRAENFCPHFLHLKEESRWTWGANHYLCSDHNVPELSLSISVFFLKCLFGVVLKAKPLFICKPLLMYSDKSHFISGLFLLRSQKETWLDHISVHRTKSLREKQGKKIKTWPIYRHCAGMWSLLNFSPKMCGFLWRPCVWCLRELLGLTLRSFVPYVSFHFKLASYHRFCFVFFFFF